MCADRVHPERSERLVRLDAACASGHRYFFLMCEETSDALKIKSTLPVEQHRVVRAGS